MRRKLAWLTIGGLVLVVAAGTWWHFAQARQLAQTQRRTTGRLLADQAVLVRHWQNLEERSRSADEAGKDFSLVIQDLTEKLSSQDYGCRFLFPANSPLAKEGDQPAGGFEKELLDRFAQTRPQQPGDGDWADRLTPDGSYQYYQAVRAQASCLSLCHSPLEVPFGGDAPGPLTAPKRLREGDLMAVVAVKIPNPDLTRR